MQNQTILSLWKKEFSQNKNQTFVWDNLQGMQTKKDFIIKAYLLAGYIKKIPEEKIGIMLPSVASSSLFIIATYLAGKIPVMFNWTLGKESFDHCVKFSQVSQILSSKNFYDKVKNDFLEEYILAENSVEMFGKNISQNNSQENKTHFVFVEDLLKNVTLQEKIGALLKSFYMPIPAATPSPLRERAGGEGGKRQGVREKPAVILFTSGSESLPKAVPLTHKNLIANIFGALEIFTLQKDDILLGFLPPFHSFGFTVNTIMPLITGLRVVYSPDPNDAKTLLEIIKHTKITAITSTPTFFKMILNLAKKEDLQSLKYVVVGAEKCPTEVFERFKSFCPNGKILEGYGITECSPVVAINPIEGSKPGTVGKIIGCLDCKIIKVGSENIHSLQECKTSEQGMIYVSGDSIFNGYLDIALETPFEDINGKQYYKTGDLGFLDENGFLTITGRLKRFVKIAGEMISLPFVENILLKKYGSEKELTIAIEAGEKDGNVKIVLFGIYDISLDEANTFLRENGASNLVKIHEFQKIEGIPILGTGKTDYKSLKKMIL